jgi:hypothetical protein
LHLRSFYLPFLSFFVAYPEQQLPFEVQRSPVRVGFAFYNREYHAQRCHVQYLPLSMSKKKTTGKIPVVFNFCGAGGI